MTKGFLGSGSGSAPDRKDSRFRRYVIGSIIFLTLATAATHALLYRMSAESPGFARTTFLIYAGTFFVVLALLVLATILGRNLIKLYFEKKSGRPGSGLKTKLVRTFIILSLLPALILFVFTYALITSSADAADKYEQLRVERSFMRLNILIMLALATLLIIFAFAWFALYLSKRITVPLQALVEGAAAVSEGNLAHRVNCRAFDELGILVASFNRMTADLEENEKRIYQMEKATAWQEVAQRLAHEIKNPLTPIRLSAERVLKRYKKIAPAVPDDLHSRFEEFTRFEHILDDSVQTIIEETESLKNLVSEFLRFARLPEARLKDADVRVIIENALKLYDGRVSDIRILKEFDADMPKIHLDHEQMKRVFVNIFDNAIEAMSQNTGIRTLSIHAFPDRIQGTARIEVSDNGRGIYDENHDSLFRPYFSTRKGGTGLGLAIVRQIIAEHRGYIYAEANIPTGTRIVIDLPLIRQDC